MAFHKCRVGTEIILQIAEYCDLETLSAMMRTCRNVHGLITDFEHSISKAKIAASYQPPQDLVLSSEDEQRCTILDRNTFATVQELERRARRIDSLLNRCAFLLTSDPKILGMTTASLDKLKAGLRDGIYLADQLADLATQQHTTSQSTKQPPSPTDSAIDLALTDSQNLPTPTQLRRSQIALRRAQIAYLRSRPWRSLAWLVTLAAGGGKGYARYSARLLESDPALAEARIMAFKEVLLRHGGSLVLWGFMRGSGTLGAFVRQAIAQCAKEVLFFEEGGAAHVLGDGEEQDENEDGDGDEQGEGDNMPNGLHMCIMEELNRRIVEARKAEAADKGEVWNGEVDTWEVWRAIHVLIGKEIGCEAWRGYGAIKYPA